MKVDDTFFQCTILPPRQCVSPRSNDERTEESIKAVEDAIKVLKSQYDWDTLNVPQKIKLMQEESLKKRGVTVSKQTLYRPWIRDLW